MLEVSGVLEEFGLGWAGRIYSSDSAVAEPLRYDIGYLLRVLAVSFSHDSRELAINVGVLAILAVGTLPEPNIRYRIHDFSPKIDSRSRDPEAMVP